MNEEFKCSIDGNCLSVVGENFINLAESDSVFIELTSNQIEAVKNLNKPKKAKIIIELDNDKNSGLLYNELLKYLAWKVENGKDIVSTSRFIENIKGESMLIQKNIFKVPTHNIMYDRTSEDILNGK